MIRISVDFNTAMMDSQERVTINTRLEPQLLEYLEAGRRVILYEENDLEVEAVLIYDEEHKVWLGQPDWQTQRDL